MGRQASASLANRYRGLLDRQESSGISVAAFAKEVGVSAATLYGWRRRLRPEAEQPQLVEVDVIEGRAGQRATDPIALYVGERFRVELGPDFDGDALARVIGVLGRC